jgi:hypothetical protein
MIGLGANWIILKATKLYLALLQARVSSLVSDNDSFVSG